MVPTKWRMVRPPATAGRRGRAAFAPTGACRRTWSRSRAICTAANENQSGTADTTILGANVLTRWRHQWDGADLQVQAYYDDSERYGPAGSGAFLLRTYDLEVQQNLLIGTFQHVIWGAGERLNSYQITDAQSLLFVPSSRNLTLGNAFAQDTFAIGKSLQIALGLKFEDDPYSGWSALPDFRASWDLNSVGVLWAAAAKGVRAPTPFDVDVQEKLGGLVYLTGDPGFTTEKVTSYELGYRVQPASFVSFSISPFYNVYDDLRTIEYGSTPDRLPLHWANLMRGTAYGVSAWGNIQLTDWWRLSPSFSVLHKNLRFDAGASGILGLGQSGDDPRSQAGLTSSMNVGTRFTADASLRYVGSLPDPGLPAYCELTVRLGWHASKTLELSLSGTNLLRAYHEEYPSSSGEKIGRGVMVGARWAPQ